MRAMPRVPAGSGGCRDPGPAGAPVTGIRGRRNARSIARVARAYSLAALRSSSARSVFSQEKAVAVCFLPAPST